MKSAVEHVFNGDTVAYANYDSTKTMLGALIQQFDNGNDPEDKWAGPKPIALARPVESVAGVAMMFPHVISWSPTIDWVFLVQNVATTVRQVFLYEFNKVTNQFSYKGAITWTWAVAGNQTNRGFRAMRYTYSTGTVAATGSTVTGTGTAWQTARFAAGARIGFGSTDPTAIVDWYEITAIGSNTSITIAETLGAAISAGTPFVIEEIRIALLTTNATAANGGLWLVKGLNYSHFLPSATTIAPSPTTDNAAKSLYWLSDAATTTNTVGAGLGIEDMVDNQTHYIYNLNGTTTAQFFKFNLRATLTTLNLNATNGKTADAYVHKTGVSATVTGTISQTNNGRIATAAHGPGSGVSSLYFVTTTRVYRCPMSTLTNGGTSFLADAMIEIPPGGSTTFAVTSGFASIEYSGVIDRFVVNTTATGSVRSYVTKYNTNSEAFDHIFLTDSKQQDQSTADSGIVPHPSLSSIPFTTWVEGGLCYLCRTGANALASHIYTIPLAAHWDYANGTTNQRLITPKMSTSGASKLVRAYVNEAEILGSHNLGQSPEPFRVYARTSGIDDNSGAWTLLNEAFDLSGLTAGDFIQLAFEFRIINMTCIPARIYSCAILFETASTDSHFQPSAGLSDKTNKRFAWRFSTAFGGTVPDLEVVLFDAVSGATLLTDDTDTPTGTFEKSTNGGSSWTAWNDTDKANDTTYVRYTPASLADNVTVRAVLRQL